MLFVVRGENIICCFYCFFFLLLLFLWGFFCCENSMIDCVGSIYFKLKNILLNCNI